LNKQFTFQDAMSEATATIDLQKLLDTYIQEVAETLSAHQERIKFYSSLISAVLAATVGGAIQARQPYHFGLLLAGPVLVVTLSWIAIRGTSRLFQRFLEATVRQGKVEQMLGMHLPLPEKEGGYWEGEALVAPRNLSSRREFRNSQDFVSAHLNRGYQLATMRLFYAFMIIGGLLFFALWWKTRLWPLDIIFKNTMHC
jgi:hypothetical protein